MLCLILVLECFQFHLVAQTFENFFHLVKKQLNRNALEQNITRESYQQFSDRVKETVSNLPVATIDNISIDKRMNMILKDNKDEGAETMILVTVKFFGS